MTSAVNRRGDEQPEAETTQAALVAPERGYRPANGFAGYFAKEWPVLRRYLRRFVSAPDADELAQEAFTRMWADADVRQSPGGYLYRTARNLVVDDKRRTSRQHPAPAEEVLESYADPRPSPEDEFFTRKRLESARVVFDRMGPRCRRVFLMRVVDGYSYEEIAGQQQMSVRTVERLMVRAFKICAEWQEEESGVGERRKR